MSAIHRRAAEAAADVDASPGRLLPHPLPAHPLPAHPLAAVAVTGRSLAPTAAPLLAVGTALAIGGHLAGRLEVVVLGYALICLAAAYVLHECGHVLAYRLLTPTGSELLLVRRSWSAAVLRPALTRWRDITTTAAGPLLPALVTLPWLPLLASHPLQVGVPLAISCGHLVWLVLPSGDGRALWQAVAGSQHRSPGAEPVDRSYARSTGG